MKHWAFATCFLAMALAGSTTARADYDVIQFGNGRCEIWWNSASNPRGAGWTKIAIGMPDYAAAQTAIDGAFAQGLCR